MNKNKELLKELGLYSTNEEIQFSEAVTDIAAEITTYRAKNNMSQKDLADKMNKTQSYVSKIEKGENNLSLKKLAEISSLLGGELKVSLGVADYKAEIQKFENIKSAVCEAKKKKDQSFLFTTELNGEKARTTNETISFGENNIDNELSNLDMKDEEGWNTAA